MSLINDALIKAERDRAEEAAARAAGFNVDPKFRAEKRRTSRQVQSIPLAVVNACVLLACFAVVIVVLLRNRGDTSENTNATFASAPAASAETATDALDLTSVSDVSAAPVAASATEADSPFASAEPPETAAPLSSSDYELVGMSAVGSNTLLGITRRSDQRSVWVPVGKSVSGITAVSYDADSDRAVILVNGREHTLGLRTGPGLDETAAAE